MLEAVQVYSPSSITAALELLADPNARPLAGGTDAMVRFRDGVLRPSAWVNLQSLRSELSYIRQEHGVIVVGSLTSFRELLDSPLLQTTAPLLLQAVGTIGGPQIRNMGTLGGNMGTASPAADSLPALYALDAWVSLISRAGTREVPIASFFLGPGRTALQPGELIAGVRFAPQASGERCTFEKLGLRAAHAITLVSAAIRLHPSQACIALGAVGPTVMRVPAAEALLAQGPLNDTTIRQVAEATGNAANPISDVRASASYRRAMARNLVTRGLIRFMGDAASEVIPHAND
ncbi:MAG: FAD binding domain-containing protein [Mycobacterium leprae]